MKDRIIIERILFDKYGRVEAVDLHDEEHGDAIFCRRTGIHKHGKYNYKYNK